MDHAAKGWSELFESLRIREPKALNLKDDVKIFSKTLLQRLNGEVLDIEVLTEWEGCCQEARRRLDFVFLHRNMPRLVLSPGEAVEIVANDKWRIGLIHSATPSGLRIVCFM